MTGKTKKCDRYRSGYKYKKSWTGLFDSMSAELLFKRFRDPFHRVLCIWLNFSMNHHRAVVVELGFCGVWTIPTPFKDKDCTFKRLPERTLWALCVGLGWLRCRVFMAQINIQSRPCVFWASSSAATAAAAAK